MPLKFALKLKPTASPHLYIQQIKEMMRNDTYLHPLMKNTLRLMKKMKTPYVVLATSKEIIFVPEQYLHLERALEPSLTGYARINWSPEEKKKWDTNQAQFLKDLLYLYSSLGYELKKEDITIEKANELIISVGGQPEV